MQLLHFFSDQGGGDVALGVAFEEWQSCHPEEQQAQTVCQL